MNCAAPKPAPRCRYCGGAIKKRVTVNWVETGPQRSSSAGGDYWKYHHVDERPASKVECQKFTNDVVISVQYDEKKRVRSFGSWDGESYVDPFFCNGEHARQFGYAAARKGMAMPAYNEAIEARGKKAKKA